MFEVTKKEAPSKRKPFNRPVEANWWTRKKFYTMYMIRESSVLLAMLFALELLAGMICAATGNDTSCLIKWINFMASWPVKIVNVIGLFAVLYHTYTWFNLMPKAQRLMVKGEPMPGSFVKVALYGALFITSLVAIALAATGLLSI